MDEPVAVVHPAIEYPSSDGKPVAETPVHYECMAYATAALRYRYLKHPDVYVGANMLHYYEEGNPRASVAPDVFVVFGARKDELRAQGWRDVYKLWEEPKAPDFVLEVTSRSTRREDEGRKRELYASLGVREYFLHDPRREYLDPVLQGFRLNDGAYDPIPVSWQSKAMGVPSEVLDLHLCVREGSLRLWDPATKQDLLTYEEVYLTSDYSKRVTNQYRLLYESEAEARREAERRAVGEADARREAERCAAEEGAARRAAEEEIAELKRLLRDRRDPPADRGS